MEAVGQGLVDREAVTPAGALSGAGFRAGIDGLGIRRGRLADAVVGGVVRDDLAVGVLRVADIGDRHQGAHEPVDGQVQRRRVAAGVGHRAVFGKTGAAGLVGLLWTQWVALHIRLSGDDAEIFEAVVLLGLGQVSALECFGDVAGIVAGGGASEKFVAILLALVALGTGVAAVEGDLCVEGGVGLGGGGSGDILLQGADPQGEVGLQGLFRRLFQGDGHPGGVEQATILGETPLDRLADRLLTRRVNGAPVGGLGIETAAMEQGDPAHGGQDQISVHER